MACGPLSKRPAGDPLVAVGQVDGHGVGLIGFDLGESDLPLQVAFPLLMSNLTEVLLPAVEGILPSSMRLGESVSVSVDPRIERVAVDNVGAPELPGSNSTGTRGVGGRRPPHHPRRRLRRPAGGARA